jgi:DNA ligase-1
MGTSTPAKKRKLNDSKSPAAGRSLEYFFGKQRRSNTIPPLVGIEDTPGRGSEGEELTDEELARKLQAEWDQEDVQESQKDSKSYIADQQSSPINGEASKSTSPEKFVPTFEDEATSESTPRPFLIQPKSKNTLSLQSAGSAEDIISSNIPFDESPLTFEPSKYAAELQGHWATEGGDASYAILARCFVLVNSTQSRIKIVDTLVNLLRVIIEADPKSLLPTVGATTSFWHSLVKKMCKLPAMVSFYILHKNVPTRFFFSTQPHLI